MLPTRPASPFTIEPASEKYLSYTTKLAEETAFNAFRIGRFQTVHHMFFAQALAPEEEGVHECPVLFKPTWLPLFTTGKGDTRLDFPEGSGFVLPAGTQLVMQLHLLNTSGDHPPLSVSVFLEEPDLPGLFVVSSS